MLGAPTRSCSTCIPVRVVVTSKAIVSFAHANQFACGDGDLALAPARDLRLVGTGLEGLQPRHLMSGWLAQPPRQPGGESVGIAARHRGLGPVGDVVDREGSIDSSASASASGVAVSVSGML